MKDIEKINLMLKQFMEESLNQAVQLGEELDQKKLERDVKDAEIQDVLSQLDYVDMLKLQLEQKLMLLEEERAMINNLVEEKELLIKQNSLEGLVENVELNDGAELMHMMLEEQEIIDEDEGK